MALRPLGTHTLGCRGPTLPQAVTQPMLLGFNPFDVMMTPGMQAAVWGKNSRMRQAVTHTPPLPSGGCHLPIFKGQRGCCLPTPLLSPLLSFPQTSKQRVGARCQRFNCIPDLMLSRHPFPPASMLGRGLGGWLVGFFPPFLLVNDPIPFYIKPSASPEHLTPGIATVSSAGSRQCWRVSCRTTLHEASTN